MAVAEVLRRMVDGMPEDGSVTLPVSYLVRLLNDEAEAPDLASAPAGEDLDVAAIVARTRKAESTVRGWFSHGLIPNAYRFRGAWRCTVADFRAFQRAEMAGGEPGAPAPRKESRKVTVPSRSMGAWRGAAAR